MAHRRQARSGLVCRQAIETKYIGPTNYRGARVKATAQAGSITLSWDHELDANDNHTLADKFGWTGRLVCGGTPGGHGNVYVFAG